jgi:hypothetical protein
MDSIENILHIKSTFSHTFDVSVILVNHSPEKMKKDSKWSALLRR